MKNSFSGKISEYTKGHIKKNPRYFLCAIVLLLLLISGSAINNHIKESKMKQLYQEIFLLYSDKDYDKAKNAINHYKEMYSYGNNSIQLNEINEMSKKIKEIEDQHELFLKAKGYLSNNQLKEAETAMSQYINSYPGGADINEAKEIYLKQLAQVKKEKEEEQAKHQEKLAKEKAEKEAALRDYSATIVDNRPGNQFISLAIYIPNPSNEKYKIAIDQFRKQSSGWMFMIRFVNNQSYKFSREKELEDMVDAVYASTTHKLQIFDSKGNEIETISY
ncbi:hypothetical protein [Propionispora vibrioides]|jgi:hypothetical protein|uniref:Uncharacterized protein n=1 Tax=Propionispora vibrioides TaxID=112903 RepID=A0A1H8WX41_9FIRM|nr:hypothetical protein [Propionispora vibrioides]SEP31658.1 hypothetical protein SAMN04490178_11854 [Propionispora vibrioides]